MCSLNAGARHLPNVPGLFPATWPACLSDAAVAQGQIDYVKAPPPIRAIARRHFAHFRDPGRRDDAVANVIGLGWLGRRLFRPGSQVRTRRLAGRTTQ